ncbi:MAG: phage major capsid protein [Pseudomonadota bacterium]
MLGYPVYIDENVPNIATSAVSILFGNFKRGYEILDRNIRIMRDPYTNKPYVDCYPPSD